VDRNTADLDAGRCRFAPRRRAGDGAAKDGGAFAGAPTAINFGAAGGTRALFGTNPIAAIFPCRDGPPLSIDLSLPAGGAKGATLALMVERLVTALTGARMGFEASSFFVDEGDKPGIGQAFLAIDPGALAGSEVYNVRIETCLGPCCRTEMSACQATAAAILPTGPGRKD